MNWSQITGKGSLSSVFFDFAHESWRQRGQKILDGSTVVVLVVLVIQQQLRCTEGLGGLNGIPGTMTFDDIRHHQKVFRIRHQKVGFCHCNQNWSM